MTDTIPSTIAYRLKYTDGMFLTSDLMTTEQSYFVNTTALQNKMLYTPGVLSGLLVTQTGGNALSVQAGGGIDESGNFVILPDGGGNALTVPTTSANPSLVYLVYPASPPPVADTSGYVVNTAGVPTLMASGAAAPANSIVLAEIGLDDQGNVTTITDKRVAVTSRLGTPLSGTEDAARTMAAASPVPSNSALSGVVTVPADQLPTADKPYTTTVYFNAQHSPAFATGPQVIVQVQGTVPYPVSVGQPTATTHFVLTIGASTVTPSSETADPLQVSWWAFA